MPNIRLTSTTNLLTASACAVLLLLFAIISWSAVSTKSPVYDEPYHAASAWTNLRLHDFRIDSEDPPLWKYWAALPNGRSDLSVDLNSRTWTDEPRDMSLQWWWSVKTLFETPGNDGDAIIDHSRAMMLVCGVALGALIAWWAWRLSGAFAAIVATTLFALDPNFLAHAPLVKNDIVFSVAMLGVMYWLWRSGQRLTWGRAIAVTLLGGVMLTVKFSGVLMIALIPLVLFIRALRPDEWPAFARLRSTRRSRLGVAFAMTLLSAVVGFIMIRAVYGFRFSPSPDADIRLNMDELVRSAVRKEILAATGVESVSDAQVAATPPSLAVRAILFANAHKLLPHAWLAGFLFTYQSSLYRPAFLLGKTSNFGWWYYFPLAMLVKTPMATLLAGGFAIFVLANISARFWNTVMLRYSEASGSMDAAARSFGVPQDDKPTPRHSRRMVEFLVAWRAAALPAKDRWWTAICLALPAALYMTIAMRSNLNIGIRHILPVYPFAFIAIGCIAGYALSRWRKITLLTTFACAVLLAIETAFAFPNYIPFFNFAAGGSSNGINLLADSNVDWGQDLVLLYRWQQENPGEVLYLSYFGTADPGYYHIKYIPLRGGYAYDMNPTTPSAAGVIAVSASNLQGVAPVSDPDPQLYQMLRGLRPMAVLGGSIYLYRWSPQSQDRRGDR